MDKVLTKELHMCVCVHTYIYSKGTAWRVWDVCVCLWAYMHMKNQHHTFILALYTYHIYVSRCKNAAV